MEFVTVCVFAGIFLHFFQIFVTFIFYHFLFFFKFGRGGGEANPNPKLVSSLGKEVATFSPPPPTPKPQTSFGFVGEGGNYPLSPPPPETGVGGSMPSRVCRGCFGRLERPFL